MYVGVAYGFWTQGFVSTRGNKTKLKAGSGCSLLYKNYRYRWQQLGPARIGVSCTGRAFAAWWGICAK